MIKKLLFTAALLVPGLAYGQNPSANLSVQVVPGSDPPPGTACAVGPNYMGAIPAAAAAAGFNTCVLNMDFSDPTTFTYKGTTVSWTNPSTWLDCKGAPQPIWAISGNANCNDYSIITDTDGKTSLAADITPADFAGIPSGQYYHTYMQSYDTYWMFPNSIYEEDTKRVDSNSLANPPTPSNACTSEYQGGAPFWGAAVNGWKTTPPSPNNWVEWDPAEWLNGNPITCNYFNQGAGGEWTASDGSCGGHCYIITQPSQSCTRPNCGSEMGSYDIVGLRVTANTSGDFALCSYTSLSDSEPPPQNTPTGCTTGAYEAGASDPAATNKNYIIVPYLILGPPYTATSVTQRIIYRRMIIFSCSSWQTTACNTGVVTSNP